MLGELYIVVLLVSMMVGEVKMYSFVVTNHIPISKELCELARRRYSKPNECIRITDERIINNLNEKQKSYLNKSK